MIAKNIYVLCLETNDAEIPFVNRSHHTQFLQVETKDLLISPRVFDSKPYEILKRRSMETKGLKILKKKKKYDKSGI